MSYLYQELTKAEQREIDRQENAARAKLFASIIADSKKSKVRADLAITDENVFMQQLVGQVRDRARTNPDPLTPGELAVMIATAADEIERLESEFKLSARAAWTKNNAGSAAGFVDAWPILRSEILRTRLAEKAKEAGSDGVVLGDQVSKFLAAVNGQGAR